MELMVVIIIVVILTSSMIPIMSSASDARRCREGARLVSTMLSGAQTRAISTGRSCGVLFQPMKNNPYACMELYTVEVPPPYGGDDINYRATITVNLNTTPATGTVQINTGQAGTAGQSSVTYGGLPMTTDPLTTQRMIRPGDMIRFNYRGPYYIVHDLTTDQNPYITNPSSGTTTNTMGLTELSSGDLSLLQPFQPTTQNPAGALLPFQILRQPLKTSDPPAQLANGAAVDWYFSGVEFAAARTAFGRNEYELPRYELRFRPRGTATTGGGAPGPAAMANTCGPVILTFNATGTIDQVYYSCCYPLSTSGTTPYFYQGGPLSGAYFLVGRIEKISQLPTGPIQNDSSNPPNYQDPNARWVSITRQSGLVTTTEVAALQAAAVIPPGSSATFPPVGVSPQNPQEWAGVLNAVMNSRRYASGNQNSGGI